MNDPVAERWISTWVHLRERESDLVDGWPLVHVGTSSRRTELICVDPGVPKFEALLPHVAGIGDAMLTVVGTDLTGYRALPLPDDVRVDRDDETLMTTTLVSAAVPPAPDGLTATFETDGPRTTYRLDDGARVAVEGTMGIQDGWVTFDAVETTPAYRRRGLGRHAMTAMCARAAAEGQATHGILAASADGRALYEALGWQVERQLLSLMGVT